MAVSAVNGVFKAIIVDVDDPEQLGRVRVRIPSVHGPMDPSKTYEPLSGIDIPVTYVSTESLPWATVVFPTNVQVGTADTTALCTGLIVNVVATGGSLAYPVVIGSTGLIYGTPASMANSQVPTSADNIDVKSDVKSGTILGVPGNRKVLQRGIHKVTSPYGQRWGTLHGGIDLVGTGSSAVDNITAFAAGTISIKKYSSSYGNYILLRHEGGWETVYAHMHHFITNKRVGDTVSAQEVLGRMGTTGQSTGNHLHFEVRKPNKIINHGRIDPAPYLQGTKSF